MTSQILTKLISFPTTTSDLEVNSSCLLWCKNFLKKRGTSSHLTSISNQPFLHWGCPIQEAEIIINSHIDVVPAPPSAFRTKISGKKLFGRGSADTKAAVSVLLALPASEKVLFSLTSDEETGGASTKEFISRISRLKFGLFLEPTNLKIITQAKGMMQIKITASGHAAHGSRPWLGNNAIIHISRLLQNFLLHHPAPTEETNSTTFNFSLISGGSAVNQVPALCELTADIRFNPSDQPEKILQELKRFFPSCNINPLKIESPISCDSNNPHVKLLKSCLKQIGIAPTIAFDHGSSDARHCTALKVPAVVFGPTGDNLHQDNEWVDLKSITQCQQVLELFIQNC